MKRLTRLGTKKPFQSAIVSCGQRDCAATKLRLKRDARVRHSGRLVAEYSKVNHSTGRPDAAVITESITHAGYHGSGLDSMSLVPSAITTAVVVRVIFDASVETPARAVLPTRASTVTRVHIPVLRVRVARDPKASEPTVSESPTNNNAPWPFCPMLVERLVAVTLRGENATINSAAVNTEAIA